MLVDLRPGDGKPLEFKVGTDGVILYREATVKDRDAARFESFAAAGALTESERFAEFNSALLSRCVLGWSGFVDASGVPIPHAREIVDVFLEAARCRGEVLNLVLGAGGAPRGPLPGSASRSTSASRSRKGSSRKAASAGTRH